VESWIYLVFWFESVRIRSPLCASFDILPVVLSSSLCAAIGGLILNKWGRFKYMISLGWLFATLGTGLVCLLTPANNEGQQIGFQIVEESVSAYCSLRYNSLVKHPNLSEMLEWQSQYSLL
jgi:hypothetical protein